MKYQAIREEVKRLSNLQIGLKPQRKTTHFKGTRTISANEATLIVLRNRQALCHLYIAYAIIRGVDRPLPKNKLVFQRLVDRYVEQYTPIEEEAKEAV